MTRGDIIRCPSCRRPFTIEWLGGVCVACAPLPRNIHIVPPVGGPQ